MKARVCVCECVQCVYMGGRCRVGTVSPQQRPMGLVSLCPLPDLAVELRHHTRELELANSHDLCDP